jgi:hypothetical protein
MLREISTIIKKRLPRAAGGVLVWAGAENASKQSKIPTFNIQHPEKIQARKSNAAFLAQIREKLV